MKYLDISIPITIIIIAVAILCKEVVALYVGYTLAILLFALVSFVIFLGLVGLHKLAMLRLDYLHRKAEVRAVGRLTVTLNAGQSLAVFEGNTQTLVTAPTTAQLPAPSQVELLQNMQQLPEPETYFTHQPIISYEQLADDLVNSTNQTTLFLGTTGTSKTTTAFNVLLAMTQPYDVIFFTLKGDEYATPLGDDFINLKMYLLTIKNQVEQGTFIKPDGLRILLVDEAKSILDSKDTELVNLLKYVISVLREFGVVVWLLGQGKNVESYKGFSGDEFINCCYILLGYPVISAYPRTVLCDANQTKPVFEEIRNFDQHGYTPCIFGAYNPNQRTKPILSSIPHGSGSIDYERIIWANVDIDEVEDYPPTFQPTAPTMSLNREMSAHQKKVMALLAAYPDGELPETKAEIHRLLGIEQAGNNIKLVDNAISEYKKLTNELTD